MVCAGVRILWLLLLAASPAQEYITFGDKIGETPNPMVFEFNKWTGGVKIHIDVYDKDSNNDDYVDGISTIHRGLPGQFENLLTAEARTSLRLGVQVICDLNYYGDDCTHYCHGHDSDAEGHYTCADQTGAMLCIPGWTGPDCKTNKTAHIITTQAMTSRITTVTTNPTDPTTTNTEPTTRITEPTTSVATTRTIILSSLTTTASDSSTEVTDTRNVTEEQLHDREIACEVGFYGIKCREKCGHCKNDSCSYVDGHCLDGCQLWFIGDLCKEEIALPSLAGSNAFLRRVNDSAVAITWTQDPQIPDKHAAYYSYTVAYTEGPGNFNNGPSITHDPAVTKQTLIVANIQSDNDYYFEVQIYREMSGEKEYGWPSGTTHTESSSIPVNVFVANWEFFIVGFCVLLIIILSVIVIVQRFKPQKGDSEKNHDNIALEDSAAQAPTVPDKTACQPSPATESP
ncbi:hypothetical protein CAPTEDRAFT_188763 [Capitella teleta]|uniref:Delta-like protein n=1 Tax=Capitella teleta TaxID=283909 RepID=R7TKG8_CAPTE|nr:hypothetical protein CAPTEDRAFT_188763 [Capitella teleta]|eukprot:ELT91610.1 hypothetical protein CAPTEDRAFT_188763 [Capitella teleta]